MSSYFIWSVTILYVGASISTLIEGNTPLSIVYANYAIANAAMVWVAKAMAG